MDLTFSVTLNRIFVHRESLWLVQFLPHEKKITFTRDSATSHRVFCCAINIFIGNRSLAMSIEREKFKLKLFSSHEHQPNISRGYRIMNLKPKFSF